MFTPLSTILDSNFYYISNQIPIICSLIRHPNSNGLLTYRIMLYKEWQGTNFEFGSLPGSISLRLQALKFYNRDYWNLIGFHLCYQPRFHGHAFNKCIFFPRPLCFYCYSPYTAENSVTDSRHVQN